MTIEVEVLRPACPNVQHKTFLLSPRVKSLLLFSCFHHIWNIQYSDHNTDHCTVRSKGTVGQDRKPKTVLKPRPTVIKQHNLMSMDSKDRRSEE